MRSSVDKGGPKLKESAAASERSGAIDYRPSIRNACICRRSNATMSDFASLLQRALLDRPVVDRTGLTGRYRLRSRLGSG